MNHATNIPLSVINWTDKYFYQSAYDIPLDFPGKKIGFFLSKFRPSSPVILFRGINKWNKDNQMLASWTYSESIAKRYAEEMEGVVIKHKFNPDEILLDTTLLSVEEKLMLGYDYKIDDLEVIIFKQ